ncbi:MAG: MarR family transcriptional regulator [Clostridia bacterium]|nr:MarR family transcriptional regulator [Clostridia bacterium]
MNRTIQILHSVFVIKKAYDAMWDEIQEKYSLTRAEIDVIAFLSNNPDCDTASSIVEFRKIAKSHVSKAVDSLMERNWITRAQDQKDRRCIHLKLTDEAECAAHEILARQREFSGAIREGITEEELAVYAQMIEKITENARKMTEES